MPTIDTFIVLRHASAGRKLKNRAKDFERGLDVGGEYVAKRLHAKITEYLRPDTILSSPFRRCVQTVEPLAATLGLTIEEDERFTPDRTAAAIRRTFNDIPPNSVVCTHGEFISRLLANPPACAKGAFWVVERRKGKLSRLTYVEPPARAKRAVR